ncbi:hypothetical protein PHLCEN_2v8215 [Hermanssonia centrifuga]|uniref:Sm domain-containing protein n=1 Tax=Hermanssonia centrifuga TaxID=98765 RepID=A0A2R6NUA7_9APHY|nr:hypothetical protein PHLCEN_2v8215 [Hermanssonia centrifuga]
MAGFDQKSNVVLSDSKERVYSMEEGVEEIPLGLYLVKGDQIPGGTVASNTILNTALDQCRPDAYGVILPKLLLCATVIPRDILAIGRPHIPWFSRY